MGRCCCSFLCADVNVFFSLSPPPASNNCPCVAAVAVDAAAAAWSSSRDERADAKQFFFSFFSCQGGDRLSIFFSIHSCVNEWLAPNQQL